MTRRPWHWSAKLVLAGGAALALALAAPSAATAAVCSFENAELVVKMAKSERTTIVQEGTAIVVRANLPQACAVQPIAAVSTVTLTGTAGREIVVIDLAGGAFAGAASSEAGIAEVGFFVDLDGGVQDRLVIRTAAAGGDVVVGDAGIALNGDDDADVLWAGIEELILDGGPGRDVLSGHGGRGTGGPAAKALIVQGGGADDVLTGGRANDRIAGGLGRDELVGGLGDDVLTGGAGNDTETGGRGNDTFEQGRDPDGSDVLFGQPGVDTVSYAFRREPVEVRIGAGADDGALGRVERDRVASDIEVVRGGFADDVLRVPARSRGSYTLLGGPGADILFGGDGNDTFRGGPGSDTLSFTRAAAGVRVDLRQGIARGMGNDRVSGVEDVVGSRFADVLRGNALANNFDGWRGADRLRGRFGADLLVGGPGRDALRGDAGGDTLEGGGNRDQLLGGPGPDLLRGGAGRDWLVGGASRDNLNGGAGRDVCRRAGDVLRACEVRR